MPEPTTRRPAPVDTACLHGPRGQAETLILAAIERRDARRRAAAPPANPFLTRHEARLLASVPRYGAWSGLNADNAPY